MATKDGIIKKTALVEYSNVRKSGLQAISLRDDDELIDVRLTDGERNIVMVTHDLKTALRGTRVLYLRDGGVVGDYRMSRFGEDDIRERRNNLTEFLEDMGW